MLYCGIFPCSRILYESLLYLYNIVICKTLNWILACIWAVSFTAFPSVTKSKTVFTLYFQQIEKLLWNYNPHCYWTCSYQLPIEVSKMGICLCENAPGRWWNSNLVFTCAQRLQMIFGCHVNETTSFHIQGRRLENVLWQILRQILIPLDSSGTAERRDPYTTQCILV